MNFYFQSFLNSVIWKSVVRDIYLQTINIGFGFFFSKRMCHHWSKIDLTLMDFCIVHKCGLRYLNFVDSSSYTHTHIHTKKSPRNCISLQFLSFTSGFSIHDQIKFSFAFPRSARSENTVNSRYIHFNSKLLAPVVYFSGPV